ncbi:MAG: hypothetical protein H7840_11110 [Alphaproteobacteria bacterium]
MHALAAYATWRDDGLSAPERCSALRASVSLLVNVCERSANITRLSTLARAAGDFGLRTLAVNSLQAIEFSFKHYPFHIKEPFWPPSIRYDEIDPTGREFAWFKASVVEQLELLRNISSLYEPETPEFEWLCQQPFISAEIARRRVLRAARENRQAVVPDHLCQSAGDHINARLWANGVIARLAWSPDEIAIPK